MSKNKQPTEEPQQPSHVGDLLLNGTTVLTAKTRDELSEMVNEIPADTKYSVGAVGHNLETGAFTLRIDLSKT